MASETNAGTRAADAVPEGIVSLLDTDLYKLTMQCCVLKYFPDVPVTYGFTNRTPHLKLNRRAFAWLRGQVDQLANLRLTPAELEYLRTTCPYLPEPYLRYMADFRLHPDRQVTLTFTPATNEAERDGASSSGGGDADEGDELGDVSIHIEGLWAETILYEIPLLALVSEAYFKFGDRDWTHAGQVALARRKGEQLLRAGCVFSEFGTRRRRDYHTQDLVLQGLMEAAAERKKEGWTGVLSGTSNVHFAMKYGIPPVGTVAHEWFMGVAAITDDYEEANEIALRYWVGTFGAGVLGIALTDTYGTDAFLRAFRKPIPEFTVAASGANASAASLTAETDFSSTTGDLSGTKPPLHAPIEDGQGKQQQQQPQRPPTYAEVFTGVRQDSGDPEDFIATMRRFYDAEGIRAPKAIVFSDSLNVELCVRYKAAAEAAGFRPTFGVGTFLTNDFVRASDGRKSPPLNIVIKLASAAGRPAVKISDNVGKNTGDARTVAEVKRRLGYAEREWKGVDERERWGGEGGERRGE